MLSVILSHLCLWFALQITWLLFAITSAHHQYPALYTFRKYVSEQEDSTMHFSKSFHRSGLAICALFYVWLQTLLCVLVGWDTLFFLPVAVAGYSYFFDTTVNELLDNDLHYVGTHAGTDKWVREHLGSSGGRIKNIAALVIIVAGNIAYVWLKIAS